jgi:GNAT superfamily N-acetyltransferase
MGLILARRLGRVTVDIAFAPAAAAEDRDYVAQVVDLVNRVYAEAEKGLWQEGAERTDADEVAAIIRAGKLVEARLAGQLVGCVHVQLVEGEFGMLVAAPEFRNIGIGRDLVAFAEDWARQQGYPTMQLELLMPQTWTHPVKEFLHGWYTRIGYRPVRTEPFAEAYPALQPLLATPCDFVIYHKPL